MCGSTHADKRLEKKKSHLGNEVDGGGDDSRESTGNCSRDFCRPFSMSMVIQQNNYFEEDEIKQPNTVGGRYSELLFCSRNRTMT